MLLFGDYTLRLVGVWPESILLVWLESEAFGLGEVQDIYSVEYECPHVPTESGV